MNLRAVEQDLTQTAIGDSRFGRLAAPLWSNGAEVRCECITCGAHLLAAPGVRGELYGVCLVCGGESFTPVG